MNNRFEEAFVDELRDAYDAEERIAKALPKIIDKVQNEELKSALQEHLEVTEEQSRRVQQILEGIGKSRSRKTCEGIKGILEEGETAMKEFKDDPELLDAVLIGGCQRVEHYEIAVYGTLCAWAERLGYDDARETLAEILDEEKEADRLLTEIAERIVNPEAAGTE